MHVQSTAARRCAIKFNGVVHYEADMHAGVSIAPVGRHDYEAFETASQIPDGLIRCVNSTVYRWCSAYNDWNEVAA